MNDTNGLQEGAGSNDSLKPKGNFERHPYRRQLLHLSSVYLSSSVYYREALRPVIRKIITQIEGA